jgi:hypothetical protein
MTIARITLLCAGVLLVFTPPPVQTQKTNRDVPAQKVQALREIELLPPAEFDHEYTGKLTIVRTTQDGVRAVCPQLRSDRPAIGCSQRMLNGETCTVTIADDVILQGYGWTYDLVLRHELGHCNGWRHDEQGKTVQNKKLEGWCVVDPGLWMCREQLEK